MSELDIADCIIETFTRPTEFADLSVRSSRKRRRIRPSANPRRNSPASQGFKPTGGSCPRHPQVPGGMDNRRPAHPVPSNYEGGRMNGEFTMGY